MTPATKIILCKPRRSVNSNLYCTVSGFALHTQPSHMHHFITFMLRKPVLLLVHTLELLPLQSMRLRETQERLRHVWSAIPLVTLDHPRSETLAPTRLISLQQGARRMHQGGSVGGDGRVEVEVQAGAVAVAVPVCSLDQGQVRCRVVPLSPELGV
jgi:hypothetical protein